ncbi:T9SS type A sorting domain-containing protein [Saccharicrinis sp. FJH2]|uniref:T9SS type A sorting domain-containing protein n=1 Tax=Saccharicrinis sp. FJH65 TaxID=3344659 RepID=UPI0035F3692D
MKTYIFRATITIFVLFISNCIILAQAITVSGLIKLQDTSDNKNIEISFTRVAPSFLEYKTATDESGQFRISIENGIYKIVYSNNGYFSKSYYNQAIYSDIVLPNDTLYLRQSCIIVPEIINTIQEAINQSNQGDTVLVMPGVYKENINMNGKNITLGSKFINTNDTSYISQTIIDGSNSGRVIVIKNQEGLNCVVNGLTIRNGYMNVFGDKGSGGGIYCLQTSPALLNLIIENNTSVQRKGGGIYCENASPYIFMCIFRNNYASSGGAIGLLEKSNPVIENSLFYNNSAISGGSIACENNCQIQVYNSEFHDNSSSSGGGAFNLQYNSNAILENLLIYNNSAGCCGGAIYSYKSSPVINNSTLVKNHSVKGGGIFLIVDSDPLITNSIVAYNTGNYGIMNDVEYPSNPSISNCIFYRNSNRNFSNCHPYIGWNVTVNQNKDSVDAYQNMQVEPGFADMENLNFNLSYNSPCIDAGNSSYTTILTDLAGNYRVVDGDNDGMNQVDIGCFEAIATQTQMSVCEINDYIEIYPNPTSNQITVQTSRLGSYSYAVLNLHGKIQTSGFINSKWTTLNLEKLNPGIYFIELHDSFGEYKIYKFVINR